MRTHNIPSCYRKVKEILIMLPDLTLLSTLNGSNYPCFELIFMVPKRFEPLKFNCIKATDFTLHPTPLSTHQGELCCLLTVLVKNMVIWKET